MSKEIINLLRTMAEQQREIIERLDRLEQAHDRGIVKEAYTIEEVAERLGRSVWTVRQWCNKMQVNGAYKVRGKGRTGEWRLPHDALESLQTRGPMATGTASVAA